MNGDPESNKGIVRRAIDEIINGVNGGRPDLVDELNAAELTAAVKAWIGPFLACGSSVFR